MNATKLVCVPLSFTVAGWLATSFTITAEPGYPSPSDRNAATPFETPLWPGHPHSHRLGADQPPDYLPPPLPESGEAPVTSVILDLAGDRQEPKAQSGN